MKLAAVIIVAAFLALTVMAALASDRRCNTSARYQAMSEGADCSSPDFSKRVPPHRPNRRHHK